MKKMYVGNIPYNVTEEDLKELFSEYGEIESLRIMKDNFTDRSKGFGCQWLEAKGLSDSCQRY